LKMLSSLKFLAFSLVLVMTEIAYPGPLDDMARIVVLLAGEKPQTTVIDGITYEIGLRRPGEAQFKSTVVPQTATGFLVSKGETLILVTAKQVAAFMTPESSVTISGDQQKPLTVTLSELSGSQDSLRWKSHDIADVAILLLRPSARILPALRQHFLPAEQLSSTPPSRDTTLTVLGFPPSFSAKEHFSPLSRETHAASGSIELSQGYQVLLLQDPSVGGYSGAPVLDLGGTTFQGLTMRSRTTDCVGLISSTISDSTGGKFAAVVPATYVLELLSQL